MKKICKVLFILLTFIVSLVACSGEEKAIVEVTTADISTQEVTTTDEIGTGAVEPEFEETLVSTPRVQIDIETLYDRPFLSAKNLSGLDCNYDLSFLLTREHYFGNFHDLIQSFGYLLTDASYYTTLENKIYHDYRLVFLEEGVFTDGYITKYIDNIMDIDYIENFDGGLTEVNIDVYLKHADELILNGVFLDLFGEEISAFLKNDVIDDKSSLGVELSKDLVFNKENRAEVQVINNGERLRVRMSVYPKQRADIKNVDFIQDTWLSLLYDGKVIDTDEVISEVFSDTNDLEPYRQTYYINWRIAGVEDGNLYDITQVGSYKDYDCVEERLFNTYLRYNRSAKANYLELIINDGSNMLDHRIIESCLYKAVDATRGEFDMINGENSNLSKFGVFSDLEMVKFQSNDFLGIEQHGNAHKLTIYFE